ncbi:hypothetical protein [Undibacterium umbellatum]|uniref:PH domain-containing protein n=1 Tax=Undibacterium umbellatum TaxID=2762300 RepID=A0ABR6Z5M9_9BURK|nr:hypothetical protein [Undibacterium umbellatum]MBC3907040.1 hypothetical protein [Undibacterium umbellatum]
MLEQQQKYTFVRSMSSLSKREKWILLVPVSLLLPVFIWAGYWEWFQPADWKKILESGKVWQKTLPMIVPLGLFVIVQGGIQWVHRSSKLVIDDTGVFLEWPSYSVFAKWKFLQKRLAWADVKSARYVLSYRGVVFFSTTNSILWTIRLKDWKLSSVEPSQYAIKPAEIDLLGVFRELDIFEDASKDPGQFDLMKHPVTRSILLGICALLVYCFFDSIMQQEGWAFFNIDYLLPHVIFAALATIVLAWAASAANKRLPPPKGITAFLVVLASFSFLVTSYVAGIRINQFAGGPLISAEYHRDDRCENLIPVEKSLPVVEYTHKTKDYWCSREVDEFQTVKVRKGLFGHYQFDLSEQTQAIRTYKKNPTATNVPPASSKSH